MPNFPGQAMQRKAFALPFGVPCTPLHFGTWQAIECLFAFDLPHFAHMKVSWIPLCFVARWSTSLLMDVAVVLHKSHCVPALGISMHRLFEATGLSLAPTSTVPLGGSLGLFLLRGLTLTLSRVPPPASLCAAGALAAAVSGPSFLPPLGDLFRMFLS